jgi:hypothetical protein
MYQLLSVTFFILKYRHQRYIITSTVEDGTGQICISPKSTNRQKMLEQWLLMDPSNNWREAPPIAGSLFSFSFLLSYCSPSPQLSTTDILFYFFFYFFL